MKFTEKVEKLVFGGLGLVRHDGFVYFVPDVAQDELVEVEVVSKKKSYGQARLCNIQSPSPVRSDPKCPYFGNCGGCQLQHLGYDEQLKQKKMWLIETLKRIGKIEVDSQFFITAAKKPYGYRRKVTLHAKEGVIGYYARDGFTLLEVNCCPIFYDAPTSIFTAVRDAVKNLECKITLLRDAEDAFLAHLYFPRSIPKESKSILDILAVSFKKVWLEDPRKIVGPSLSLQLTLPDLTCYYSPRVFMQNAPDQFLQVYNDILAKMDTSAKVLDIYCGIGIFSMLAAKSGRQVVGVEINKEAIECAKKSSLENGIETAQFFATAAEEIERVVDVNAFDTWLVNPPRGGLSDEVRESLLNAAPENVFYISCEPTTLARDLSILSKKYTIASLQLYDMFAQTTHFETVVQLVKSE
jgi:23S rRNA (uracil1939-C5)-methyltransferase